MPTNEKTEQQGSVPKDSAEPLFPTSSSLPFSSFVSDTSFENKRLNPIDVLLVDKQSRLTLTKKVKRVIPLNPNDKVTVYEDKYSKDIVLEIQYHNWQHQGEGGEIEEKKKLENWVLTIRKKFGNQSGKKTMVGSKNNNRNSVTDADDCYCSNDYKLQALGKYKSKNNDNTLYSIPVILVDDNPDMLMAFDLLLKNEGYRNIKTFSSSKTALKYLLDLNSPPQNILAITDIRMPDINGIQLYQILKIINPSVKIIFLTGLDAVSELTSMYPELKTTDILRKPIEPNQFIKAVNDKVIAITDKQDMTTATP